MQKYGKTEVIDLFNIVIDASCTVKGMNHVNARYAAYLSVPDNCNTMEIIGAMEADGADHIFIEIESDQEFKINQRALIVPVFTVRKGVDKYFIQAVQNQIKRLTDSSVKNNTDGKPTIDPKKEKPLFETPLMKLFITFPYKMTHDKQAKLDFFYSPANVRSFDYIDALNLVYAQIKDYVSFEPFLVVYKQTTTSKMNKNCYLKTGFCAADPDGEGPFTGADVVEESLRQKCIFKQSKDAWFSYMKCFATSCPNDFSANCSSKCVSKSGVDSQKTIACVGEKGPEVTENTVLRSEYTKLKETNDLNYPSIYINGDIYMVSS